MEKLPIILLALVCAIIVFYMMILRAKLEDLFDRISQAALNTNEFMAEGKRELSKTHCYVTDVDETVKKLRRRVKRLEEKVEALEKQQAEYESLADESVRAQIDAEKAWAEGVRAIAGYGASIPTLNTKELGNE